MTFFYNLGIEKVQKFDLLIQLKVKVWLVEFAAEFGLAERGVLLVNPGDGGLSVGPRLLVHVRIDRAVRGTRVHPEVRRRALELGQQGQVRAEGLKNFDFEFSTKNNLNILIFKKNGRTLLPGMSFPPS